MAKFPFNIAIGFELQTAEQAYPAGLNGIGATWGGDPNGTDEGLLLGAKEGIGNSGITALRFGRNRTEKSFTASTHFTRGFAHLDFLEITGLTLVVPLVGSRRTTTATPVDGDFVPLNGMKALYAGAGLDGNAWGSGVGHSLKFDHQAATDPEFPIAGLVYFFGNRVELLDCRVSSLVFSLPPGDVGTATFQVEVGSILDPAAKGISVASPVIPVLTYGAQASVAAPAVKATGTVWNATRGFNECTITIAPVVDELGDSNAPTGLVKEISDRVTTVEATFFSDSAGSGEVFELDNLLATVAADLKQLSFTVGVPEVTGSLPAEAMQFVAAQPETIEMEPVQLGTKAGTKVKLELGHATVAGDEFELILE